MPEARHAAQRTIPAPAQRTAQEEPEGGPAAVAALMAGGLADYAKSHALVRGPRCQVCVLPGPLLDELRAARTADPLRYTYTMLSGYLRDEHGIAVAPGTMAKHWRDHER